ncbi:hypothetical protein A4R43_36620 [Amycolatopsis albispora]|uniref:Uncharacterized protein n=1 Tax=Amycolatopsis albispora TaxID=1804986 RepID=A0A344LGX1_9PSEU|nr:hypothetical protein A4R43_36620 [Amycolatopsis albispora]
MHRASSRETPLPFDDRASGQRDNLRALVLHWAAAAQAEFSHRTRSGVDTPSSAHWMASLGGLLAEHPQAAQMVAEFRQAVRGAGRAQARGSADRVFLGRCREETADGECATDVFGVRGLDSATCPGCGRAYSVDESLMGRRAAAAAVTGTAAQLLEGWQAWSPKPVSRATLFRYLARLQPVNPGAKVRKYRVLDLAELVSAPKIA